MRLDCRAGRLRCAFTLLYICVASYTGFTLDGRGRHRRPCHQEITRLVEDG